MTCIKKNTKNIEILGEINDNNSFERVYNKWQEIMWKQNLFIDGQIIGIKHDKNRKLYLFYYYENESKLLKDNAFLPHILINK
tara:strand:- start:290 stop:538 length:249 start_codon:yes stop_codon:yes gene_type:complete